MSEKKITNRSDSVEMVFPEFDKEICDYVDFLMAISNEKESAGLEEKFFKKTNEILAAGDQCISKIKDKKEIQDIKMYFRKKVFPFVSRSVIAKRGCEKPRGYPGDYAMLEMIYDNKMLSSCILGKYFDLYLLRDPYVKAVRNRKEKMKELLRDMTVRCSDSRTLRILNIASGGARDIRELFLENSFDKKIEIVCVDQDPEALDFSKREIDSIKSDVKFCYIKENIAGFFINQQRTMAILNNFDVIYSIGLIDYVPDSLLKQLVGFCFDLLLPNGCFVLAVKNTKVFKPLASDWFCDWNFYLRDQADLIELIKEALNREQFDIHSIAGKDEHISFVSIAHRTQVWEGLA